jgi:hypothetical protein
MVDRRHRAGPAGAYFSTFTRAWEIALGALIGIATTRTTRLSRPLARTASAAAVLLFATAGALIGGTTPFPGAAALLPTAATALLLVGGLTERVPLPNRALCLAPLRFLGRISYSVYLWHWPLIVFAAALYPTMSETAQMRLLILLIAIAVATLSFYLVEQPGRRIGATANSTGPARKRWAEALRRIRTLRPDVLLLSEHLVVAPFRSRADIAASLAVSRRAAAKTIVLGHTPLPQPWSSCLVGADISRCFTALDATFRSDRSMEQQLAARAGATFVDTSAWLCVRAGAQTVCPPVIAGVPAFKDDTHISAEYQLKLIPIVRALLLSSGVAVAG